MALPPTAKTFSQALDPSDQLDFYVYLNQGEPDDVPAPLLLTGEGVASYSLALTPEAIAAGLEIMDGSYANALAGNELKLWLCVSGDMQASPIFDGAGVIVGIEVTIVTTATPARTKQRTVLVKVANQ